MQSVGNLLQQLFVITHGHAEIIHLQGYENGQKAQPIEENSPFPNML